MTLAEKMQSQNNQSSAKKVQLVVHMPEVKQLMYHLEVLYNTMVKNEQLKTILKIKQLSQRQQPMSNIIGQPVIQTRSWYNPGQGIKQSAAVT